MRINCPSEDVNTMLFSHRGKELHFRYFGSKATNPTYEEYQSGNYSTPIKEAHFIFDDFKEIDELYNMISMFRKTCLDEIGEWSEV